MLRVYSRVCTALTLPQHKTGKKKERSLGARLWQSFVFFSAPTTWQILLMWHLCNCSSQEQGTHCNKRHPQNSSLVFRDHPRWCLPGENIDREAFPTCRQNVGSDYLHTSLPDLTHRERFFGKQITPEFCYWQSMDNRLRSCKMHLLTVCTVWCC